MQAPERPTSRVLRRHCRVSPQRRVIGSLCRSCCRAVHARGRTPSGNKGAAAHPAIEASPAGGLRGSGVPTRASPRQDARGGRIAQRLSLAHGTVLGLGPLSSHLAVGDGRAISAELCLHAGKPVGRHMLRSRVTVCTVAREPEPSGAFCNGGSDGLLDRKRRATGQTYRSQR
jgi:hypothetical protein